MQSDVGPIHNVSSAPMPGEVTSTLTTVGQPSDYVVQVPPFKTEASYAIYCSADAKTKMLAGLEIDYMVQAIIRQGLARKPSWTPLVFVARSPEDPDPRLIVRFEADNGATTETKFAFWEEITEWTVSLCKILGKHHQADWEQMFSRFSVVVW